MDSGRGELSGGVRESDGGKRWREGGRWMEKRDWKQNIGGIAPLAVSCAIRHRALCVFFMRTQTHAPFSLEALFSGICVK